MDHLFFNMVSKFERFFLIKFANFRPFSEAMKYKKINDIGEIIDALSCLKVF